MIIRVGVLLFVLVLLFSGVPDFRPPNLYFPPPSTDEILGVFEGQLRNLERRNAGIPFQTWSPAEQQLWNEAREVLSDHRPQRLVGDD